MNKYNVYFEEIVTSMVTVEAENEDDVSEIARDAEADGEAEVIRSELEVTKISKV
jgi:hypothetical protein